MKENIKERKASRNEGNKRTAKSTKREKEMKDVLFLNTFHFLFSPSLLFVAFVFACLASSSKEEQMIMMLRTHILS
jgi:hypothetical protein